MLTRVVLTYGLLAALPAVSPAALIIGNLPGNDGSLNNIGQGLTASVGFTVGGVSYTLTDARLRLRLNTPANNAPQLRLTSDLAGTNTLLTFTTHGGLPTGDNTITFTAPTAFTLVAGNTYYLTLGSSTTTGAFFNWLGNNPPATPTGPAATFAGFRPSQQGFPGPLSFQLNGTAAAAAVPAPAGLILAGLGAPALGLLRLRRRSA